MKKGLILLFLAAFLVRLIALDQSFWLDETTTANVIRHFDFLSVIKNFSPHDFHPPLYYLFMKLWSNIFGYSEIALRMPSVLFSLGTGWMIYKIAKWLNGQMVAWWATAFFLFNPLIVYYSQEARMYMLVTLFVTKITYYLLRISESTNWKQKDLILCNLFIFLSLMTFYGSIFFIATIYLYLLFKKNYKLLLNLLPGSIVSAIIISPLFMQQLANSRVATTTVLNWKQVLGTANLKNILLIPIKFTTGRIDFHPLLGLWTLFVFYFAIVNSLKIENWKLKIKDNMFLFLLLFPLVLGFFVSFYTPLLQYFRFIYLVPIMCLIIAQNTRATIIRIIVAAGFLILSLVYLLNPQFHREDWKSLSKSLDKNQPVYAVASARDPLSYYRPDIRVEELKSLSQTDEQKKIIIPYVADIYGINYKQNLNKSGFKLKDVITFRSLSYEIWEKQ